MISLMSLVKTLVLTSISGDIPSCDANGLARSDEIDYTLGYEKESRIGTVGFGILNYTYPYHRGKSASDTELFFSYSPAGDMLSNLYLNIYSGIVSADDYYQVGYAYELELSSDVSLSFDAAAGYAIGENVEGWKDFTGAVVLSAHGIDIGFNASVRGLSEFYDDDEDEKIQRISRPQTPRQGN